MNNPDNLHLPVPIHTKLHQFCFDSCWNKCVLQNLPDYQNQNANQITHRHLELAYQFILSFLHAPSSISDNSPCTSLPIFCHIDLYPTVELCSLGLMAWSVAELFSAQRFAVICVVHLQEWSLWQSDEQSVWSDCVLNRGMSPRPCCCWLC